MSGKAPIEELLRELGKQLYNPNEGQASISLFIRNGYSPLLS